MRTPPGHSAKPSKSILKKSGASNSPSEALFPASKKDKRKIKHARLMSKVTKSTSTKPRRRRPNNKLVTTLDDLASALPNEDDVGGQGAGPAGRDQVNIITRRSMKSRPGALKRRERLDRGERDRFSKNMAQMATTNPKAGDTNKWAALRGFISQTLEKRADV